MTPTPARVHIPAKPDYQVDQIRRYMRRHTETTFRLNTGEDRIFSAFAEVAPWGRGQIRDYFNAARRKGLNQ